jgi:hypothetical protein
MTAAAGDLIAERRIEFRRPDGALLSVVIRLAKPQPDPLPGGAWKCNFEIDGLDQAGGPRSVSGEDSYQALLLALELIAFEVDGEVRNAHLVSTSSDEDLQLLPRKL